MPFQQWPVSPGKISSQHNLGGVADDGTPAQVGTLSVPAAQFFTVSILIDAAVPAGAVAGWNLNLVSTDIAQIPPAPGWPQAALGPALLYENLVRLPLSVPIEFDATSTIPGSGNISGWLRLITWELAT